MRRPNRPPPPSVLAVAIALLAIGLLPGCAASRDVQPWQIEREPHGGYYAGPVGGTQRYYPPSSGRRHRGCKDR